MIKLKILCYGIGISSFDITGEIIIVDSENYDFSNYLISCKNKIIVTDVPSPSIVLLLNEAKGLITRRGGTTCHAATICREIGKPAIVGATEILEKIKPNMIIRAVSENGRGIIYET